MIILRILLRESFWQFLHYLSRIRTSTFFQLISAFIYCLSYYLQHSGSIFNFFSPTPLASPRPWLEIKLIFGLRFYWIQIELSRQGYNVMPINHEVFCQCNLKYFLFTNESRHALLLCNHASDNLTAARWRYPAHILNIINLTDILDLGNILQ